MITCEYCGTRTHDHEQIKCLSCGANLPEPINHQEQFSMALRNGILTREELTERFFDPMLGGQEPPVTITTDPAFVWK